jgi:ABC-type uncharacterized transport system substrate-binding protein
MCEQIRGSISDSNVPLFVRRPCVGSAGCCASVWRGSRTSGKQAAAATTKVTKVPDLCAFEIFEEIGPA